MLVAGATALLILLFPLPIRKIDKSRAVRKAVVALMEEKPVWLRGAWGAWNERRWRRMPFLDSSCMRGKALFFQNRTALDDGVFLDLGLQPNPGGQTPPVFYLSGNALIEVTTWDHFSGVPSDALHFNYYYGSMGAQGYRMSLYRNLLGVFPFFTKEWAS
jgi:hypothetical protein